MLAFIFSTMHFLKQRLTRVSKQASRGFTLLEMLVVIGLIAAVIGLVVTNLSGVFGENQEKTVKIFVNDSINTPLEAYKISMGRYPNTQEGLIALIHPPTGDKGRWKGPYLKKNEIPEDPWGNQYQYRCPGIHNPRGYDIWSWGAGGEESEDSAIGNW
jgi:general secretion pathway protein G